MISELLSKLVLPEASGRWSVPSGARALTRLGHELHPLLMGLSGLETRLLARELERFPVDRPIYVTGMARAGTTITLEILHHHPAVATHRYYQLPLPQLPHWSSRLIHALPLQELSSVERIHADRLRVTRESPEMVEERLWMAGFGDLHREQPSDVLDASTHNPRFEGAYADHIRKLCYTQGRPRYAAKNNNLATRLPYLHRLFGEARILLIVRHPVAHVASLHKQQRLISGLCEQDPGLERDMMIAGHYEFGPLMRFLHPGSDEGLRQIREHWRAGRQAEAWATYWAAIYGHLAEVRQRDPALAAATHVVRYEDLCRDSGPTLDRILAHVELDPAPFAETRARYTRALTEPDYYRHGFTEAEVAAMERITADVAAQYGY